MQEKLKDPLELVSSIGKYLGDNTDELLIHTEGLNLTTLTLPSTPCVIILGDERYHMAVDQTIVNDHVHSPLTALSYLFSLYYVLNIRYPKDAVMFRCSCLRFPCWAARWRHFCFVSCSPLLIVLLSVSLFYH
ncbi:hypothetical protein ANANG_G00193770, partial [Anguilla anguilla]